MATTPNYGWVTPDNTSFVKDGAQSIRTVSNSIDATSAGANFAGLVLIKTQTIGTAVSSVTVTGAFSTTYDAYKIVISGGAGSVNGAALTLVLGATVTNYNAVFNFTGYAAGGGLVRMSADTKFSFVGASNVDGTSAEITLINPFLTKLTYISAFYADTTNTGMSTGFQNSNNSHTAFTISGATLTGGLISVYGYRKAI